MKNLGIITLSLAMVILGYSQESNGIGLSDAHYPTMFDKNQHSTVDVDAIKQAMASKPNLGYIPDKIQGAYIPPPSIDFGNLRNPFSIDGGGGGKKRMVDSIFEGRDNRFATEYYHLSKSHTKSADGTKWIKKDDYFINGIDSERLNKHYENQENISYSSANSSQEGIIVLLVIALIITGGLAFYFYRNFSSTKTGGVKNYYNPNPPNYPNPPSGGNNTPQNKDKEFTGGIYNRK